MAHNITSSATVHIERPARWARQLVSHLSRRHGGEWTPERNEGWIDLKDGSATVGVVGEVLSLSVTASANDIELMEQVVGGHLLRFAGALKPEIRWNRSEDATRN
ncbi:DUF2218 domain-containing protein [Streptomyces solaniscabiei]|uniref:DUF2218 domain-containing protein n=1 Tax=Streptomyces solaniscabiei TaxID=2683255 RepID=UPI001CE371FE|nr:DUF2218 domain-containing protein [Streptomyces solaniscabiei]